MKREDGYIRYVGMEEPDLEAHDGRLRPAVGAWNVQVVRANKEHPEMADGVGNTYNHAPNITYWKGNFYLAYLSNPRHEHLGAGQTFLCTSPDALHWSKPRTLFEPLPLDLSVDNGFHSDLFDEGDAWACMHQRMNFYIAPDGRLLAVGFYGISPEIYIMPCSGYGIGRVVREIYADGTFGNVYMALPNTTLGYDKDHCPFPDYRTCEDAGFVAAVNSLLCDKLTTMQWWEENRDWPEEDFFALRAGGEAFNYYELADGRLVGLWKKSRVAISEDKGKTWSEIKVSPSLVMSGGKVWGERTSDGRFALCYNPNTDSCHRWPLAVVTGEDGIEFRDMLYIHGEVPPQRYWGFWRDCGPNYIRGLEAGAVSPDGAMYLTYSVNKEDIWVSRVPMPITGRVTEHGCDDFNAMTPRTFVPGWNGYSGVWGRVSMETIREKDQPNQNGLRLRCKDPYDYAAATRVFPESEKVRLHATILPRQNYYGRLEIDLTDGCGVCVYRVILDSDRTVKLKGGNGFSVAAVYGGRVDLVWEVDCVERTVVLTLNGQKQPPAKFFNSARTVERLAFRTGRKHREPLLDVDQEFTPAQDLPNAGEPMIQESIFYITAFDTQAVED